MTRIQEAQDLLGEVSDRSKATGEGLDEFISHLEEVKTHVEEIGGREHPRMMDALQEAQRQCQQAAEALEQVAVFAVQYAESL